MRGIDVTKGMRVCVTEGVWRKYGNVERVARDDSGTSVLVVFDQNWFDASEIELA